MRRVFGKGFEHGLFYGNWEVRQTLAQAGRGLREVVTEHFKERTAKRRFPCKSFIHHDAECILITGRTRLALDLFRGHVEGGSRWIVCREGVQGALHHR